MNSPPLQVGFFNKSPKYLNFLSLAPSHLLKVTKFLVKISQFEFLIMTEKNFFVYKPFLSLKKKLKFNLKFPSSPERSYPLFQQSPPQS